MKKIFLENGYFNAEYVRGLKETFIFVWGGRGTGKTYGLLKSFAIDNPETFLYLRRNAIQANSVSNELLNPFKAINADSGTEIRPTRFVKNMSILSQTECDPKTGKYKQSGSVLGYMTALTTIGSLRSADLSDVEAIILDEFVPELNERKIRNMGSALANGYETIVRNRELKGRKPPKLICVTNSNTERSDIILDWGLAEDVHNLFEGKEWIKHGALNGQACLIRLLDSPISRAKEDTALYRALHSTSFYKMAVKNEFAYDSPSTIKSIPLNSCSPIVTVNDITIYDIKGSEKYYITKHKSGRPVFFADAEVPLARFRRSYPEIWVAYLENACVFDSYESEMKFLDYYGAKI